MKSQLTFVHALSPLHAGIGQGAGVIDLPIAREKATGLPFLPGSSTKGALRTRCSQDDILTKYQEIFGSDPSDGQEMRASSIQFTDQRLLFLPIRSMAGTFAWVTSPYILHCFARDLIEIQGKDATLPIPQHTQANQCVVTSTSTLKMSQKKKEKTEHMVYLEDFDLQVNNSSTAQLDAWAKKLGPYIFRGEEAWQTLFIERLCLVHDDLFHFMCQHATEITTRIRLQEEAKTVTSGGLWYEEALPTETVLSGIALINRPKGIRFTEKEIAVVLQEITGKTIQFGGKATVGRGLCRVNLV